MAPVRTESDRIDPPPDAAGDRVEVRDIVKSFGGDRVLDGVSLAVEPGSTLALLGPSGCGKTTLLRIIAGLEVPESGEVLVDGRVLTGPGTLVPPEQRRVGMVFQDWALFPHLSVARNVGFGLPRAERRGSPRVDEALALVGMEGFADRMPDTLSGGQQQRVALARAVAPRPRVLLLDEPFSNLDATLRVRVRTEIHALLQGLGVTAVFVTHDQDEAFVLGDRVAVVSAGRVVQHGPPQEIYERPATPWVAGFVGDAVFVPGRASGATVATELGALPLDEPASGAVRVLLRPEQLDLEVAAGTGSTGSDRAATVELVEYVGRDTTYHLVSPSGLALRVRRRGAPTWSRGDRVLVRPGPDPVRCFPGEAEPGPGEGGGDRAGS